MIMELSPHWKKFFDTASNIDNLPVKDWKTNHIVIYFAKKYEEHYKITYTFSFNGPPSKSSEIKLLGKLANMLTRDPVVLKDYIDWYFENEIVKRKRKINSIAAIAQVKVINDYKFNKLLVVKKSNIDRSTILPPHYLEVVKGIGVEVQNYGDLAFINKASDGNEKFKTLIKALEEIGLDTKALDAVK